MEKLFLIMNLSKVILLHELHKNGTLNGVSFKFASRKNLERINEIAKAKSALIVNDTGIFDSHEFLKSMLHDFEELGGLSSLSTEATVIENYQNEVITTCKQYNVEFRILSAYVVNASGHSSVDLLKLNIDEKYDEYANYLVKGHYLSCNKLKKINQLYYPLPDRLGLGVHLTIDMIGAVRFGPDTVEVQGPHNYTPETTTKCFSFKVTENFYGLNSSDLMFSYAGVRPKITLNGVPINDFISQMDFDNKLISVLGIESPGLTSALAIGQKLSKSL